MLIIPEAVLGEDRRSATVHVIAHPGLPIQKCEKPARVQAGKLQPPAPLCQEIVDELAAPDMLLQYSLHEPRRGHEDIKAFMTDFRKAFPDLNFRGAADLIAEGDYVVGRWEGGGTHTGQAFSEFLAGSLPANTGRTMKFTGTTVLKLKDGKILEEIGLDDGVTALQQLGLIRAA